jgi:hypothetical protein
MVESTTPNDMNMKVNNEDRISKRDEREEKITNILFSFLIVLTGIGTSIMIYKLPEFTNDLIDKNPSYNFPKLSDLSFTIVSVIFLIFLKILIEKLAHPISLILISNKYLNSQDEANFALGKVYIKKLSTNIFKLIFYTIMVTLGYVLLSQLDYFPRSLGGSGELMNMFSKGYPDAFYHWKPKYFDMYYLTALGFCVTDLIWLFFIYELQSDFVLMLLHHVCTISLISFSYLTNWSNIGCIVLFLHDVGDIFVYITRIVINTDLKSWVKLSTASGLIIVYIYTRIYVFADVIMSIIRGVTWGFTWPTISLTVFLCFLFIMHMNWVYLILKKIIMGLYGNKIEDPASVKKVSKQN